MREGRGRKYGVNAASCTASIDFFCSKTVGNPNLLIGAAMFSQMQWLLEKRVNLISHSKFAGAGAFSHVTQKRRR